MLRKAFAIIGAAAITFSTTQAQVEGPPEIRKPPSKTCECSATPEPGIITVEGIVVDAEVTLTPDMLSAVERQATIFDVSESYRHKYAGRTRIWHETKPEKCGLTFDYGKKYSVPVRKTEGGQLETDSCLFKQD